MINAFTVDVEDYFQVHNLETVIDRRDWERQESRVIDSTRRVLDLLDRHGTRGTFFVLTWNADRLEDLVRMIHAAGHEVASHGQSHRLVYEQEPDAFQEDIEGARLLLERMIGEPVIGYRAPSYSITSRNLWGLERIRAAGYLYDSSVYPIRRGRYGIADAPRRPYEVGGGLVEFPMTTLRVGRWNLPAASGAYLRLLPVQLSAAAIAQLNRAGHPAVVNVHPWELDPDQPRIRGGRFGGFTHYFNLSRTEARLASLLESFRFGTMSESLRAAGFPLASERRALA